MKRGLYRVFKYTLGYGINIERKKKNFQGLYISSLTLQKVNLLYCLSFTTSIYTLVN